MRFTIQGILAATVLVAIGLHSLQRWRHIAQIELEIEALQLESGQQPLEPDYVVGHTAVCEQVMEDNPLPSPYFMSAVRKHEQLFAKDSEGAK